MQHGTARDDELESWSTRDQARELFARSEDMLEVIDDEQQLLPREPFNQRGWRHGLGAGEPAGFTDRCDDACRICNQSKLDKHRSVGKQILALMGECERKAGLAASACACEGD
jgi:hypothetical protein